MFNMSPLTANPSNEIIIPLNLKAKIRSSNVKQLQIFRPSKVESLETARLIQSAKRPTVTAQLGTSTVALFWERRNQQKLLRCIESGWVSTWNSWFYVQCDHQRHEIFFAVD